MGCRMNRWMSNSHTIFRFALCSLVLAGGCSSSETPKKASPVKHQPRAGHAAVSGSTPDEAGSGDEPEPAGTGGQRAQESGGSAGSAGSAAGSGGKPSQPPAAGSEEAGSGGAGSNSRPDEIDRDAIAAGLAAALCAALEKCVGAAKLAALSGREDCTARYTAGLRQDELGTLDASVADGRVKIDGSQFEACYRDTRALGCAVHTERLPASCQSAIAGQQHAGDTCSLDADCVSEHFCPITAACPRQCEPTRPAAESCERDAECQRGLLCTNGECAAPSKVGETCAGASGKLCALGLSCMGSDDTTSGKCQTNASIQAGARDAVCMPGGTLCKEGLSCAYDGSSGFKCQAAVAKGATCRLALPSQCPVDTYCNAPDVTSTGTCLALPVDGDECVLGDDCAPGHICVVSDDQRAICHRIANIAEPCDANELCRSGVCDTTCVLRERCE
jgi:hypothetical protein